jgi:CHAT domain-containing protein
MSPASVPGSGSSDGRPPSIDDVLASISGAWIVHIAAHGNFRADSPLFSSLTLDAGPLFVHDLDHLRMPPHRVVLSACDTGVAAPVGADQLLGLVSGLLRVGAAGVLASVVPVNDEAASPFMLAVQRALLRGMAMPEAALAGRRARPAHRPRQRRHRSVSGGPRWLVSNGCLRADR